MLAANMKAMASKSCHAQMLPKKAKSPDEPTEAMTPTRNPQSTC